MTHEEEVEAAVRKFRPWFPCWHTMRKSEEPMPVMTPREALLILEDNEQNLYDGGSGNCIAGTAHGVLEDLVSTYERNSVIKP
jgi:hypothetical protein